MKRLREQQFWFRYVTLRATVCVMLQTEMEKRHNKDSIEDGGQNGEKTEAINRRREAGNTTQASTGRGSSIRYL